MALKERARQLKGEDLSAAEIRRIDNNSDTITLPRGVHQKASSSKGYNKTKAKEDAADLQGATKKYSKEHVQNSKGTESAREIELSCDAMDCKTNKQYDKHLERQLDKNNI